jgi:hypothetical protein
MHRFQWLVYNLTRNNESELAWAGSTRLCSRWDVVKRVLNRKQVERHYRDVPDTSAQILSYIIVTRYVFRSTEFRKR